MVPMQALRKQEVKTRLRRGWTTGACAAAATVAAYRGLHSRCIPDAVTLELAEGQHTHFDVTHKKIQGERCIAGVIKDAGDDPDVTHQALVLVGIQWGAMSSGITFRAGEGVGVITRPGLPLEVGEPAINPAPRRMIQAALAREAERLNDGSCDVVIEIAIPNGAKLAKKTWNPRLGIEGGLSILGTTGRVIPYSCSAWIFSIHRGVDVAREAGVEHIGAATGKLSETVLHNRYSLPEIAIIDMGDFVGGLLKYLRHHPLKRLSIVGGAGKLSKLAAGALDLHSGRSKVDFSFLSRLARRAGAGEELAHRIRQASSMGEVLVMSEGIALGDVIALMAQERALSQLYGSMEVEILVINRNGRVIGFAGGRK